MQKNKYIKSLYLLLLFLVCGNAVAQQNDRNVVWVHGLGGTQADWTRYDVIFENERNINGSRPNVANTGNGIAAASNRLENRVNTNLGTEATNSQNMGIGHSMGGLLLRDMDSRQTDNFGGIITVASPNYGAGVANSVNNGDVTAVAQNACEKLSAGPASQLFGLPWAVVGNLTTQILCNTFIDNDLVQDLVGNDQAVTDLSIGSPALNTLNSFNATIPRISVYAEENSPVHWRLMSSTLNGNDTELQSEVNSARGIYNGLYTYHTTTAIACAVGGFWNPWCWAKSANSYYKARQWKKGRDWIDDSETVWSSLIQTSRVEQETYWVATWIPCDMVDPMSFRLNPTPNLDCGPYGGGGDVYGYGYWEWQERTRWITVNYPSDGLLPKYTQELQDIPSGNKYQITGANHMELLDMSNSTLNGVPNDATYEVFEQIFDRQLGDFFRTD